MTSRLDGLRERKLVQWALAYLAGAWLLLQVLDLLGDNFEWPRTLIRSATVLLGVGFLAALVLAGTTASRDASASAAPSC